MKTVSPDQVPDMPEKFRCPICGRKACGSGAGAKDWLPLEDQILAWLKDNYRFFGSDDMAIAAKYEAAMKQKAGG